MTSRHDPVLWFETNFGIQLKRKTGDEHAGPCPWCGGRDRFRVWRDKQNYACRPAPGHCGRHGFLDELTGEKDEWKRLNDHERRILRLETQQREIQRRQEEQEERIAALEKMAKEADKVWEYHTNIYQDEERLQYWLDAGFNFDTIQEYQLGWSPQCPMDWIKVDGKYEFLGRPSFTIPVISNDRVWDIRHRLIGAEGSDKYRPHVKNLPPVLFNADSLRQPGMERWILEGEKKSIAAAQAGLPNVGIMGKQKFMQEWVSRFADFQTIYVCLDPDALEEAFRIAKLFDGRGKVVNLPDKIDDLLLMGWEREDLLSYAQYAWRA